MKTLLCIETSSKNCSIAIIRINEKQNQPFLLGFSNNFSEEYSHSEQLTTIIKDMFTENKLSLEDIHAIGVSSGPGSYTGLRIGLSVAKGLCYSLNIPLISASTLLCMSYEVHKKYHKGLYCPMIDARRMEVYTALYDGGLNNINLPNACIVDSNFLSDFLKKNKIYFFGDGSIKLKQVINDVNAHFINDFYPSAKHMLDVVFDKYQSKDFENIAYYEPNYLKDFHFKK